jgi:hypothetical protein
MTSGNKTAFYALPQGSQRNIDSLKALLDDRR